MNTLKVAQAIRFLVPWLSAQDGSLLASRECRQNPSSLCDIATFGGAEGEKLRNWVMEGNGTYFSTFSRGRAIPDQYLAVGPSKP